MYAGTARRNPADGNRPRPVGNDEHGIAIGTGNRTAKAPFLPEGMNVKAVFTESGSFSDKGMILPKSAVQSDETLTEHWVMKLVDDSTAVRVPIEVGNSNASEIEIKSTALSPQDRIILTGGYGLEDGAKVVVTKEEAAL